MLPLTPILASCLALSAVHLGGETPAESRVAALPGGWECAAEVQANTFTWSSQDAAAVAQDANGATVVVWHSRRQQGGNYGIYARRFDAQGRATTPEIEVNQYSDGPQTRPSAAFDGAGRLWIAWESLGQDGDAGTVIARRFDGALETRTDEVVVNDLADGHQGEVALACAADGTALVLWTTPGAELGTRVLRARRLGASGQALGASFEVGGEARATLPAVAAHAAGGWTVAWSEHGLDGRPRAIRAQRLDALGTLCGAPSALFALDGQQPVEPVLARDGADLLAAWLVAEGEVYVPHVNRFIWDTQSNTWRGGSPLRLADELPGYTSGMDLTALGEGRCLLAWTRFSPAKDADLRGALIEADGSHSAPFALSAAREGAQRLAVGGGARRIAALPDGRMALVWHGDSGAGDGSAANLTLLQPAEFATADGPATAALARFEAAGSEDQGAAPHEPPVRSGPLVPRESFGDTKSLSGPDFGFLGITQTPLTPPDPNAAVGPGHVVEVTNGAIAWFKRDGLFQFQQAIDGGAGFWAPVGANGFIFDPEVIFDPDSRRFMAMANERSGASAFFLLAVSDNDDPNGTWFKYRFNVTAAAGDSDIDSPNLGVDGTAIYMSADFFGPDKYLTFIVEKAPTLIGAVPVTRSLLHTGSQSWGIPVMYDPAPAYYMAESFETPTSSTLRLHAITNPLGTPIDTTFNLAVPTYEQPENPPQMGTTTRPETFEARFWSCVFRNGRLYATHHTGATRVLQRWYEIDMANWPVSGTPSLVQSGNVDPGPGVRTFFGSIGIDGLGNVGLVYARSAANEFISMARSFQLTGAPAGSTTPSVIMKNSAAPDDTGRWGDYSSCVADPDFDSIFWGCHEFRPNNWATWVGVFGPCAAPVAYCTAKLNSLGGTPSIGSSGEPSLGGNSFQLTLGGAVPNTNAIYLSADAPAALPFFNAFRCVASPFTRSDLVLVGAGASASTAVAILPDDLGRTRYFQWWFRDPAQPDGTGVGLSNGLEVTFCP